jgi:phage tail sheath gpL-like
VTSGSSTVVVKDGVVNLLDTVTMYHPAGDPLPPYRFVVDQLKIWNVIYNLDIRFNVPEWAGGAPLLPDATPSSNPNVKKPKMAKAMIAAMIDGLAAAGILANPAEAKKTIVAEISSENPKRIDIRFTAAIAGNTNITSINYFFGFQFGTPALAA